MVTKKAAKVTKITKIPRIDAHDFFDKLPNKNRWDLVPIDHNFQILIDDVGAWHINPVEGTVHEGVHGHQFFVLKLGIDEFSKLVAGVLNIEKEILAGTVKVHPDVEKFKYMADLLGV